MMALEKRAISDIPADAIMLTEEEAMGYHYKILNNWKNKSDVFAYRFGGVFLGTATILTGAYINNYFRTKLKLFSYGRVSSYLPICIVPATMCFLLHHQMVLKDLVLLKQECPVCIQLRGAAVQAFFGLIMPLALAPVSCIALAHRYGTYNIPQLAHEPLEVLRFVNKRIMPIRNILFAIFLGNALLGSAVTYFEAKSIFDVNSKLSELEKNLEHSE